MSTTYALWGRGECTPVNAKALLADYMSESTGAIYRPVNVARGGIRNVVNVLEEPAMYGDAGTIGTEDMLGELLGARDEYGDEVVLLALLAGDVTPDEAAYVSRFIEAGVTVLDLSAALDEVTSDNLEARTVVPEPVKPKRQTRKLSDPKPVEEEIGRTKPATPELQAAFDAEVRNARNDPPFETIQDVPETPGGPAVQVPVQPAVPPGVTSDPAFGKDGEFGRFRNIAYLDGTVESATGQFSMLTGLRGMIRAEVHDILKSEGIIADFEDPPGEEPGTTDYYMNPDGVYRRAATGKPKRGEILVSLTPAEVAHLGEGA